MKTLLLTNQKGGVGKTAIACQFSFYLSDKLGLRVLGIDLDHQANYTKVIKDSGLAAVSDTTSGQLLLNQIDEIESEKFLLIKSDNTLTGKERQPDKHNAFAANLRSFLHSVGHAYDVCIIDTNPNPDIRVTSALIATDYVLSPIQLNQEALDGATKLFQMIKGVQKSLNQNLNFLGLLPTLVNPTNFQKENFATLVNQLGALMVKNHEGKFLHIKDRTAFPEAQAACAPLWKFSSKTSAQTCWSEVLPVFQTLTSLMEIHR